MVTTSTNVYTANDLLAMGADAPYELIRGELRDVTPTSMKPSVIGGRVFGFLFPFVEQRQLGYLTNADGGYYLSRNRDTIVAPDVGFVRKERLPGGLPDEGYCSVPPDLAVEVTSPTDEARDIADKLAEYQ